MSDPLGLHELQHARLSCPSLSPRVCSDSCPLSRWCQMMPSNHLILCHPLFLLPLVSASIRVFSSESALCIRWPKYWSFNFSISPSSEYSGLISFRIDLISWQSKGLSVVSSSTTVRKWKVAAEPQKDAGILDLRRRRIQSRARDKVWSLRAFVK